MMVNFVMLNPSTADELKDDRTIKRCIKFVMDWGGGGIYVTNLFAFRTKNPKIMKQSRNPIGKSNDRYLKYYSKKCQMVILAWGGEGGFKNRDKEVLKMIGQKHKIYCIEKSLSGFPKHPVRLAGHLKPIPFY